MTRINTNTSSLVAQNTLQRSHNSLQTSLTRLSTGLRINDGKDDPAGLIASESLRSDITNIGKAIGNSQRANQVISTADSALAKVSSLLNDIRGLATEAANSGVLSVEQISANQLQVDASLVAIDRIAQTTTFQGKKLLDGSLEFIVKGGSGFSSVNNFRIDQTNLGSTGSIAVKVDISAAATKAQVTNSIPATANGQVTFDNQTFSLKTTQASALSSVTVAVAKNSGPEATGSITVDGRKFKITAATGQTGIDAVTVTTTKADHAAEGTATIDGTSFAITAAGGSNFDGAAVEVAKSDLGLAKNQGGTVSITDASGDTVTFNSIEAKGSIANLSNKNGITIAVTTNAAADGANYDVATNTLNININSGDAVTERTGAALAALIQNATVDGANVGQTFTVGGSGETAGGIEAGAFVVANGTLTQEQAQATFSAGTNKLTITLNSNAEATVTGAAVDTAVTALSEIASVTPTGSTNINVASLSAGNVGTLNRVGVKASYADGSPDTLTLEFDNSRTNITVSEVLTAIDGLVEFSGTTSSSNATDTINGTSFSTGSTASALKRIDGVAASFDASLNVLTLTYDGSNSGVTATQVKTTIDALTEFESTSSTGSGTINGTKITANSNLATAGRVQDLVIRIAGALGSEVFAFQAGTSFDEIASAIQLVSDATGVTAAVNGSKLELTSSDYGSKGLVDVEVISEGAGGTFAGNLGANRSNGTDVQAKVNGLKANGDGNKLSVNTAALDLSLTVAEGSSTDVDFTINGGGAVFQLGPDVVSSQQARIGVQNISTGKLGNEVGRLFELRSGNSRSLANDVAGAAAIVEGVITSVAELRGRLGAFQSTTVKTNIDTLQDTLVNLTEAESSIRDADYAKESAALTRAQILVQAGTSVLQIANSNPQNVLALLRG